MKKSLYFSAKVSSGISSSGFRLGNCLKNRDFLGRTTMRKTPDLGKFSEFRLRSGKFSEQFRLGILGSKVFFSGWKPIFGKVDTLRRTFLTSGSGSGFGKTPDSDNLPTDPCKPLFSIYNRIQFWQNYSLIVNFQMFKPGKKYNNFVYSKCTRNM